MMRIKKSDVWGYVIELEMGAVEVQTRHGLRAARERLQKALNEVNDEIVRRVAAGRDPDDLTATEDE